MTCLRWIAAVLFLTWLLGATAACLKGEVTAHFSPQPSILPGQTEYAVTTCSTEAVTLSGGLVWAAATPTISPVTRANVLSVAKQATNMSWQRKVLMGIEFASYGVAAAASGQYVKIKEIPGPVWAGIGVALRTATTLVNQNVPAFDMPDNYLPPLMQIPAGACLEYSMFASTQPGKEAFSAVVGQKLQKPSSTTPYLMAPPTVTPLPYKGVP